mgnify:CR=1 FL=1
MVYNPTFERSTKGKFNQSANYISLKSGTNAYVLEDELNEIQWIQSEARADLVRQITASGVLQLNDWNNHDKKGALCELGSDKLNSFSVNNFQSIIDGYLINIKHNKKFDIEITLPDPPSAGSRYDFIFLEVWFKELKQSDETKMHGGVYNDSIDYNIIDPRIGSETSRRVQLQWAIRVKKDVNIDKYNNGFIDSSGEINKEIHPRVNFSSPMLSYNFKQHKDKNIYVSGDGTPQDKNELRTVDGFVYALPLFAIKRLNNSGIYDDLNEFGATDYVNEESQSIRPDGKFSNIIYSDQVIDLRNQIFIGKDQYDIIYAKLDDFENLKKFVIDNIDVRLGNLELKVSDVEEKLDSLDSYVKGFIENKIDYLEIHINKIKMRLDLIEKNPIFRGFFLYGINVENDIFETSGGILNSETGIVDSLGTLAPVLYKRHNRYSVLFAPLSNNFGQFGDIWIEKADINFLIKNTGSKGLAIETGAIDAFHEGVVVIRQQFNGLDGVEVSNDIVGENDFVFICPTMDPNLTNEYMGENGEIFIKKYSDKIVINNTGSPGGLFELIVIDTSTISNAIFTEIELSGSEGTIFSDNIGVNYQVYLSNPIVDTSNYIPGSIGDISIKKSSGYFNVYNTGSKHGKVQCLILIDHDVVYE